MTALPRLLLLTDRSQLRLGRGLVRTVLECAEAGLTHVVLRELDLGDDARAAIAGELAAAGLVVIAAHRPVTGTTGIQLPSAETADLTRIRGAHQLCGRSCHTRGEAEQAAADGFDYVTLGPFASTASKPGYGPPLPRSAYAGLPLPAYALGGLDAANAEQALDAGAHGVAVMGAVMRAAAPAAVVRDLLAVVG